MQRYTLTVFLCQTGETVVADVGTSTDFAEYTDKEICVIGVICGFLPGPILTVFLSASLSSATVADSKASTPGSFGISSFSVLPQNPTVAANSRAGVRAPPTQQVAPAELAVVADFQI
jgi:hypothetical protein